MRFGSAAPAWSGEARLSHIHAIEGTPLSAFSPSEREKEKSFAAEMVFDDAKPPEGSFPSPFRKKGEGRGEGFLQPYGYG
jgi:hypothetical protein